MPSGSGLELKARRPGPFVTPMTRSRPRWQLILRRVTGARPCLPRRRVWSLVQRGAWGWTIYGKRIASALLKSC